MIVPLKVGSSYLVHIRICNYSSLIAVQKDRVDTLHLNKRLSIVSLKVQSFDCFSKSSKLRTLQIYVVHAVVKDCLWTKERKNCVCTQTEMNQRQTDGQTGGR